MDLIQRDWCPSVKKRVTETQEDNALWPGRQRGARIADQLSEPGRREGRPCLHGSEGALPCIKAYPLEQQPSGFGFVFPVYVALNTTRIQHSGNNVYLISLIFVDYSI